MARMRGMYAPEDEPGSERLPGHSERRSWLLRKMVRIQEKKLRKASGELSEHLFSIDVEAHMYMLPWLRLLFSREYPPEEVWLVWDAVFAETPADFELADFIAVSLLWHLRAPILRCDALPDALKLLCHRTMHNECAAVLSVIEQARIFRRSSAFYFEAGSLVPGDDDDDDDDDNVGDGGDARAREEEGSGGPAEEALASHRLYSLDAVLQRSAPSSARFELGSISLVSTIGLDRDGFSSSRGESDVHSNAQEVVEVEEEEEEHAAAAEAVRATGEGEGGGASGAMDEPLNPAPAPSPGVDPWNPYT